MRIYDIWKYIDKIMIEVDNEIKDVQNENGKDCYEEKDWDNNQNKLK